MKFDKEFEVPLYTDIIDYNGVLLQSVDTVRLTFNEGTHSEHIADYVVEWVRGGFAFVNRDNNPVRPHAISNSVKVERI